MCGNDGLERALPQIKSSRFSRLSTAPPPLPRHTEDTGTSLLSGLLGIEKRLWQALVDRMTFMDL